MKLVIDGVSKLYKGNVWGLRDFSLQLEPGVLVLVGPNGAGKSTLMRILATITKPTAGRVTWNGTDIAQSPDELRAVLGYLPQDFGIYPNLNAVEFLEYIAALKGLDGQTARKRIQELLHVVNLFDLRKRPLGGFSGGMKQRLGIAQALLNDPQLLIVDEPTAGLDPEARVRFRNLLSDLAGDRIVILATHIVSDAEAAATEVALINQGYLLEYAEPEGLLQAVEGKVWQWVIPSGELTAAKQQHIISSTARRSDGVHMRVVSETPPGPDAQAITPTLEDAYLYFISIGQRDDYWRKCPMKTLRTLYHLTRADFLERIRRYSFLIVLALTVWAGYLFVPPEGASYLVLFVGLKRGIYNSAWIGLMFGFIAASHLALLGFYLVKNAVERDRQTGVGQIIATTPIGKPVYVIGKWLSNLAVLATILSVMTVMAAVMQLIRAEDATVNLWALVAPIWLMGLPVLAIAAAMAVLFESISFLRGGLGNVAYFFVWTVALATVLAGGIDEATDLARPFNDLFGYTRQLADIQQQVLAVDSDANMGSGLITPVRDREVSTFAWDGVGWTVGVILGRMMWAGMAVAIALASAIPFDRFDPARSRRGSGRSVGLEQEVPFSRLQKRMATGWLHAIRRGDFPRRKSVETGGIQVATAAHFTPLAATPNRGRFFGVLAAELKLMLRGHSLVWYTGAIGLIIACLTSPLDAVQQFLLPAVWLWPALTWAQMGIRERRYNTGQMVFSAPHPVSRQLPAMWLAGVIFTVIAGSGAWMRLALMGEITSLLAWFVGALFTPSLALALGVWVGNSRAFELVYPFLWYIGVINQVPAFDYAGATAEGLTMGMPVVYLGITAGLVVLAAIGRWRQLQI